MYGFRVGSIINLDLKDVLSCLSGQTESYGRGFNFKYEIVRQKRNVPEERPPSYTAG